MIIRKIFLVLSTDLYLSDKRQISRIIDVMLFLLNLRKISMDRLHFRHHIANLLSSSKNLI